MTASMSALPSAEAIADAVALGRSTSASLDRLLMEATTSVRAKVTAGDRISSDLLQVEQRACHGLAWLATYIFAIRELVHYADRLADLGTFGETERLIVRIGLGEYVAQIFGGIPMSQGEIVRLADLHLAVDRIEAYRREPAITDLMSYGNTTASRAALADIIRDTHLPGAIGEVGTNETSAAIRAEIQRFVEAEIAPHAHGWHLANAYIPIEIITQLSDLGVFGLTIPEAYGGLGLPKEAMCVVTEELSRGYIGVGSLGTRSEIAAELILAGGTEAQKAHYLPKIASGEILPTAVFTEPNTGSDLASLKTRAVLDGDTYRVSGNKTWITHPVRADLMTLLVRTNSQEPGYKGLSILLADKPRGTDEDPFPADGMTGGEIEVLGYRGMKEYEIGFDGFEVPASGLLGGVEGQGFKQLMTTFESARIQTAARAVGVAQAAMETAIRYARERMQFGKPLIAFPRVADKIVMMAVETMIARQITFFAARAKDEGRRTDLEAGMAKLLGARVAWAAADNALQIHGGNGFALEYPVSRLLCDARILNIFEGAAEIQAQVIARRLLDAAN